MAERNGTRNELDRATKYQLGETSTDTVQRKRRPRKSAASSTENPGTGTGTGTAEEKPRSSRLHRADFQVVTPFVDFDGNEQPESPVLEAVGNVASIETPRRKGRVSKSDKAYNAASELTTVANILAVSLAGPEAGMNIIEEPLITGSLARVFAANDKAAEKVSEKMTPFALLLGVTIWGIRVGKLAYDRNKDKVNAIRDRAKNIPVRAPKNTANPVEPMPDNERGNGYASEAVILREMLENDSNI